MALPAQLIRERQKRNKTEQEPTLRKVAPGTYGFLGGLLGTAPDEFKNYGTVLDPAIAERAAQVKSGADIGYPIGIGANVLPVASGVLKWAGAGEKIGQGLENFMQAAGYQLNAVPKASSVAARNLKKGSTATVFDGVTNYDDAMRLARSGAHLKQNPTGQYIGAPRSEGKVGLTVDSPGALANMRRQADAKVAAGSFNAPWYDRARTTAEELTGYNPATGFGAASPEGSAASLFSRGGAAYSPQATPPTEINSFIRQHNAKVVGGDTVVTRTGSQSRNVDQAYQLNPTTGMYEFNPDVIRLGKKTGPYGDAKDPTIDPGSLYKTASDIWHGRVMGYSNPGGKTFNRGFTPQEHGFLTGENLLLADRAERAGLPVEGASANFKWDPRAAQAATWGAEREASMKAERAALLSKYEKASAKYDKQIAKWEANGKAGPKPARPTAPQTLSDEEIRAQAMAGIDQATNRLVGSQTYEYVTGENVGQLKGLNNAPEAVRAQYSNEMQAALGDRDPYFAALQMYQKPVLPMNGSYVNSAGVLENNPAFVARPIVGLENSRLLTKSGKASRGGPAIDAPSRDAMDWTAGIRSVMDAQEGVGWNKFSPANSSMKPFEKTGLRFTGTRQEMDAAKAAYEKAGLDVIDVGDALHVGKFPVEVGPQLPGKHIQDMAKKAELPFASGKSEVGRLETGIEMPPWGAEGSGDVSRYLTGLLEDPSIVNGARRLDSVGLPQAIGRQNDVINRLSGQYPVRQDFMKLRDLIANDGFTGYLDYVKRNGYQGLPAVGFGYPGLYQDDQQ